MVHWFANKKSNVAFRIALPTRWLAVLAWFPLFSLPASPQITRVSVVEESHTAHQHFYCTADYAPVKCGRELAELRQLLSQYRAEMLGDWQWVIVSRSGWKPFCANLGVDSSSPAMTSFVDRQSFFEESLFDADADRVGELIHKFGVPWKDLLPLAVTHELGHAVCRDTTESGAEVFAEYLRHKVSARCGSAAILRAWSHPQPFAEK
jgi:hypothetical protein